MLSSVLRSPTAIKINLRVISSFFQHRENALCSSKPHSAYGCDALYAYSYHQKTACNDNFPKIFTTFAVHNAVSLIDIVFYMSMRFNYLWYR